jgi:hypothetical protein
MKISMQDLKGANDRVLAGALAGRKAFSELVEQTSQEPDKPEPLFLDFGEIEVATASYLRESVLAFRDAIRRRRSKWYPVVANAKDGVTEELKVLVGTHGNALMLCDLDGTGTPHQPRLLGDLDPKQRVTFDLVLEHGETDAAALMKGHGEREKLTAQTAWNNRLAVLANLGLIVEISQGRAKRYRPLFAED